MVSPSSNIQQHLEQLIMEERDKLQKNISLIETKVTTSISTISTFQNDIQELIKTEKAQNTRQIQNLKNHLTDTTVKIKNMSMTFEKMETNIEEKYQDYKRA